MQSKELTIGFSRPSPSDAGLGRRLAQIDRAQTVVIPQAKLALLSLVHRPISAPTRLVSIADIQGIWKRVALVSVTRDTKVRAYVIHSDRLYLSYRVAFRCSCASLGLPCDRVGPNGPIIPARIPSLISKGLVEAQQSPC